MTTRISLSRYSMYGFVHVYLVDEQGKEILHLCEQITHDKGYELSLLYNIPYE